MDGIHDLGGMHGFGAVVAPGGEAPYHERWEARVFALHLLVELEGLGARPGGRATREEMDPVDYLAASYYERWLWSAEQGLLRKGTIAAGEVEHMMERLAAGGPEPPPHRDPEQAARAVEAAPGGRPDAAGDAAALCARPGRAGAPHAPGRPHPLPPLCARRPGRGGARPGCRRAARPAPSTAEDAPVEPVYAVAFRSDELWGRGEEPPWTVALDLWESYLEEAE